MSVGADFALVVPLGTFGDIAGIGLGALPKFGYMVTPDFMGTARLGYIFHLAKDIAGVDSKVSQIPIMFGGKYMMGEVYGAAEIGFVNLKVTTDVPILGEVSASETNLAFGIGGGYMMGPVDLRLGLHMVDLGNAGDSMELMVNVGYDFAQF